MVINILRPGAFGDIVLTSMAVAQLPPEDEIHYYTGTPELARHIDHPNLTAHKTEHWGSRPPGRDVILQGYAPKMDHTNHLAVRFCYELGVAVPFRMLPRMRSWSPPMLGVRYITVQTTSGWSTYKDYPYFQEVLDLVGSEILTLEIDESFTWAESLALIQHATLHLGVDSVCQVIAAAYQTPAVVLYGSTDPSLSGFSTAINLRHSGCRPCFIDDKFANGWRCGEVCSDPCILKIPPSVVAEAVKDLLNETN